MKEVFSQFGGVIISIAVSGVLFALIGALIIRNGVGQIYDASVGERVLARRQVQNIRDRSFDLYNKHKSFTVTYLTKKPIYAGEEMLLDEHFVAEDCDGTPISLQIEKVVYPDGSVEYPLEDKSYVSPEEPGVYEYYLKGNSTVGKAQTVLMKVPIQERISL